MLLNFEVILIILFSMFDNSIKSSSDKPNLTK
jgi:hypothetical protein